MIEVTDPGDPRSPLLKLLYGGGPSCSACLIEPFARTLPQLPRASWPFSAKQPLDHDARLSIEAVLDALEQCVGRTGDAELGISAGLAVSPGSFGAIDYAMYTSPDLRAAVATAARFGRLLSDTFLPRFERAIGSDVFLRLGGSRLPRAAGDFVVVAMYVNHLRLQLGTGVRLRACFAHPRPSSVLAYESALEGIEVEFDCPAYGFVLPSEALDRPLTGKNPVLNSLICAHAEIMLSDSGGATFVKRTRELIMVSLNSGQPVTGSRLARELHVSRRTLVRRLHEEGTSFLEERDRVRKQLAIRYVTTPALRLSDVASLLGFLHLQTFHRAFKRWTKETPQRYRERHRASDTDAM